MGPVAWYEAHFALGEEGWNNYWRVISGRSNDFSWVNEKFGWAHTVNFPDLLDTYNWKSIRRNDGQYRVG